MFKGLVMKALGSGPSMIDRCPNRQTDGKLEMPLGSLGSALFQLEDCEFLVMTMVQYCLIYSVLYIFPFFHPFQRWMTN